MARTELTPTELAKNDGTTTPAGTTIDATLVSNGAYFAPTSPLEEYIVRVTNTHSSAHDVTVPAGDSPPALLAGQGALVEEVPLTSGDVILGPLTSGRFMQNDGNVHIDFATGHTGAISVIHIPRTA